MLRRAIPIDLQHYVFQPKEIRTSSFKPILFLFLYISIFYSLLFFIKDHTFILSTVSNILLTIANLISVIVLFKAFTNPNNQNKKFTLLLFLGCLTNTFGSMYWIYFEYVYVRPPSLGLYDLSMLLAYLFFLWALIHYIKIHKVVSISNYLFDILIFTVLTSTLSWVFIIHPFLIPTYHAQSLLTFITYLGYPIADLSVLFASLIGFLCTPLSRSVLFISLGFFINIMANSLNFYQSTSSNFSGHLIDPLWALSILLIGFSGLNHFHDSKAPKKIYSKKYIQLFIPYSIMIIFLFVVYINFYETKDPLLIGVFISTILLTIRLFITIHRNEALNIQLKNANDQLRFLAYHDELTKLPNRHFLFDKIKNEMNHNQEQSYFSLLFIDLDGFKSVNDKFGHNVGDVLLQQVSSRLKEQLLDEDFLSRFAGDEFIMLVADREHNSVVKKATAIVESLSKPYFIDSHEISISSSIGISSFEEADSILSVINKADKAMYNIKKNGKNGFGF